MKTKAALFCLALVTGGIASAHAAQNWNVTLPNASTANLACADTTKPDTCLSGTGKTNVFDDGATITISCANVATCSAISLSRESGGIPVSEVQGRTDPNPTPTTKVYTLTSQNLGAVTNVGVFSNRKLLASFTLAPGTAGSGVPVPQQSSFERSISDVRLTSMVDCPTEVAASYSDPNGDGEKQAVATMYVDVLGNVIAKPRTSFDENDSLTVYVLGDGALLERLKVARTSGIRDLSVVRVIGEGTSVPSIERHAAGAAACKMRTFDGIDSFAPGKGVVTISRAKDEGIETVSNFELNVAPLYSGIFTLGAAVSNVVNPKYKLVTDGTDQVIARGDASSTDTLFTVFYTPFVWGKRDVEKPMTSSNWYRHINPSIGLVLDNVSENILAGISVDFPRGIVITAGWHYRKVDVLSEESGLAEGSVFTGAADTLPVSKKWESDTFVALTIDIRVMAQLIKSAFTAQ